MRDSVKNFAIGFVIYSPPPEFLARIEWINRIGYRIYIYDNSPEQGATREAVEDLENVVYVTAGKNLGLGIGLSTVCAQAYYDSAAALLFFDQDTVFDPSTLEFVGKFCSDAQVEFEKNYTAVVFGSGGARSAHAYGICDVRLAISSGSLFFLGNLRSLGWHNETYFVDGVDYELCLRSLARNLKIGRCPDTPGFDHVSGQPDVSIRVFGKPLPMRRYRLSRIADTSRAYARVFFSSIRLGQLKFAGSIFRSYAIYVCGQILARIILR
jgi:rhamnosyltransferase